METTIPYGNPDCGVPTDPEAAWGVRPASGATRKSEGIMAIFVLLLALAGLACGSADDSESSSDDLTLKQAVGQMLLIGFRGTALDDSTAAVLREIQPGGVLLFDRDGPSKGEMPRNITSPEQLRALTTSLQETASIPYFIAVDAEGGYVNRLKEEYGFTVVVPSAQTLGAQPVSNTAQVAGSLARQLQDMGINWNLAPVADVNIDPASPAIGKRERAFSDDPEAVAAHAGAFIEAHCQQGVVSTLKHFPGHGSAAGDTHLGVTDITDTYQRETELAPYRQLIADGYDGAIMTAHVINRDLDPSGRPATLSYDIITGLLRDELGFDGVILSDDMQMGAIVAQYSLADAAVAAVHAGVDIILLTNQHSEYDLQNVRLVRDAIMQAVADGEIPEQRIRDSAQRILTLKQQYNIQ